MVLFIKTTWLAHVSPKGIVCVLQRIALRKGVSYMTTMFRNVLTSARILLEGPAFTSGVILNIYGLCVGPSFTKLTICIVSRKPPEAYEVSPFDGSASAKEPTCSPVSASNNPNLYHPGVVASQPNCAVMRYAYPAASVNTLFVGSYLKSPLSCP